MALDINGVYQPKSVNSPLDPSALNTSRENQGSGNSSPPAFDPSSQETRSGAFRTEAANLSLSAFDSARTGFLTESDIINGINTSLGRTGIPAPDASSNDFTPEAVAGRVLEQVSSIIEQFAGSPEEANEILQQARKGIANGIDQARETLNALGALNETTQNTVRDTETFIEEGLTALEESLSTLFDQASIVEEQEKPQPQGEKQVIQTQTAQVVQGASLAQARAEAEERARPSF